MKLSTKVAYNTIIQLASKIIATALGLFSIRLMAGYLGTEGFGQYTTVITFLSFFAIIADLGLTLVTVQLISQKDADEEKILNNLFSLRFVSAILFIGAGPLFVFLFPYGPAIKSGVLLASLSFFFIALNQVFVGLFQKRLRLDKVSIAEVAGRIALLAGIIITGRMDYGLTGILAATVASSALSFLLHYLFSRKLARVKFAFDPGIWKEVLLKSWPLAVTITFNLLYLKTDTLVLSLIKTLDEVGIYGAAYKVIDVLVTLPFLFSGIVLPILTAAWSENDREKFGRVLQKAFNVLTIFAFPMVAGTWLISTKVMTLVASKEFAASGPVLNILIVAGGAIFLGNIFAHAIIAIDRQKSMIPAYIFTALSSIIGYLIFIPRYSYFGAAAVTVYSESLIALLSFYVVWKYIRFVPDLKILLKSFLASAVMYLAVSWLDVASISLKIFWSALIYVAALYSLKGITKEDLLVLNYKQVPAPITDEIDRP